MQSEEQEMELEGLQSTGSHLDARVCESWGLSSRSNAALTSAICEKAWGKLPTRRLRSDIVFFREQAEVVAQLEQALQTALRVAYAADGFEAAHHPEAAGQEDAFAGRQAVLTFAVL